MERYFVDSAKMGMPRGLDGFFVSLGIIIVFRHLMTLVRESRACGEAACPAHQILSYLYHGIRDAGAHLLVN